MDTPLPQLERTNPALEPPPERVLSTLNPDGSRRWLSPRLSVGRIWHARRIVAWLLIAVFTALPWLRIRGQPPILLDVVARKFVFFGVTFRPTDTLLLALLFLAVFVAIFLATALFGRVWCGWACPQTVYLEFVYRPLERLFLGRAYGSARTRAPVWRRIVMYAVFLVLSAHLANTFLAYFVGTDQLVGWTLRSPTAHPTAFIVFAVTVGLMMFDFVFFREQLCTLICPYGRFQSVLLDRDSLIVGYDRERGEPRGKLRAEPGSALGDCIDCRMCVTTCPTGIDIRDGLQLECIHCAQCIDACDTVMDKIGRPRGLIRYSSQNRLERASRRGMRVRAIAYPILLAIVVTALATLLLTREPAMVVQLRTQGTPYSIGDDGRVVNLVRLRIDNRTDDPHRYTVEGAQGVELREPVAVDVGPIDSGEVELHVVSAPESFVRGRRELVVRVRDGAEFDRDVTVAISGPFGSLDGARP